MVVITCTRSWFGSDAVTPKGGGIICKKKVVRASWGKKKKPHPPTPHPSTNQNIRNYGTSSYLYTTDGTARSSTQRNTPERTTVRTPTPFNSPNYINPPRTESDTLPALHLQNRTRCQRTSIFGLTKSCRRQSVSIIMRGVGLAPGSHTFFFVGKKRPRVRV